MEATPNRGSHTLEVLSALSDVAGLERIPERGPATRQEFIVRTQPVHARQSTDAVQLTGQVAPAIVTAPYDLYRRSWDAPRLKPPNLRPGLQRALMVDDALERRHDRVSEHPLLNQPQLFSILEIPERNAELLDGRKRAAIHVVSGNHRPLCLKDCRTLGIDSSSLMVLSHLGLLGVALSAFDHVKLPPNIISDLRAQRNDFASGYPDLASAADRILNVIESAMKAGNASCLSLKSEHLWKKERDSTLETAHILAALANECDAICVDDARHNHRNVMRASNNREVPVSCILDVLRRLVDMGSISDIEYWFARHKLRQGGFAVLLPEANELHHWLKTSQYHNGSVVECFELRMIRQALGHMSQACSSSLPVSLAVMVSAAEASADTVNSLWMDKSLSCCEAAVLSDWVQLHTSPLRICGGCLDSGVVSDVSKTTVAWLAYLLVPRDLSEYRKEAQSRWIEDAILPYFRPANLDLVDSALGLIADIISDNKKCQDSIANGFLKQLPNSLRNRFLRNWPDLGRKWGFEMRQQISFDSGFRINSNDLVAKARQAYSQGMSMALDNKGEGSVLLGIDEETQAVLIDCTDSRGHKAKHSVQPLDLLSRSATVRVAQARKLAKELGATSGDLRRLIAKLESRPATDEEIDQVFRELSNGVNGIQDRLYRKLSETGGFSIDDLVPSSLTYFDRFVGPSRIDLDVDEYLREVVIPYRKQLLHVDLESGLEIACLGFLRDDLAPGEWIRDVDSDVVWGALQRSNCTYSPIMLLGALDIALYRQDDPRIYKFASDAVSILLGESFGRSDGFDSYRVFSIVVELILNRISTIEGGPVQPGYWRRMGAWMQAGLFVNFLARCQLPLDVNRLQEFANQHMTLGGSFAQCVDARIDGLVLASRAEPNRLRHYVLERLLEVRRRHENLGHGLPGLDWDESSPWRSRDSTCASIRLLPGPLDGGRAPTEPLPGEWRSALTADVSQAAGGFPWNKFVTLSQSHAMDEEHLEACRAVVRQLGAAQLLGALRGVGYASYVAAASRDALLADAIADAIRDIAARASEPHHVRSFIGSLLQAGAVHVDRAVWSNWIGRRLVEIAERLPPPPNTVSRVFRDCLDELATILPADAWIHLRARRIATCIAPSSPDPEDLLAGGWLAESLSELELLREEAVEEGSDEPTETALRSARGFLESLATLIHQCPDIAAMAGGSIGVEFRNQTTRGGVLFVIERDGSGACYTLVNGVSKHFVRPRSEELLDDELRAAVTSAGVG